MGSTIYVDVIHTEMIGFLIKSNSLMLSVFHTRYMGQPDCSVFSLFCTILFCRSNFLHSCFHENINGL